MPAPFVCHVEWGTLTLLNWKHFSPNYLIYIPNDGGIGVGILQSDQVRPGGTPNVSIRVEAIDSMLAKAEKLGRKVVVPKTQWARVPLPSSPHPMET